MARLAGKVAIVTGGARGMGEATVRLLVEEGEIIEKGQRIAVLDTAGLFEADVDRLEASWRTPGAS